MNIGDRGLASLWHCNGLFDRPPSIKSASEFGLIPSKVSSPLRYRHAFTFKLNADICALIVSLLSRRGPITIVLAVRTIVISTFNRFVSWAIPHISNEINKFIPAWFVADTSSAIPFKGRILWFVASGFHVVPRMIGSRIREAVGFLSFRRSLFLQTATRLRVSTTKVINNHPYLRTTRTLAEHFFFVPFQDGQSAAFRAR